jgi:hypothetical protein
MISESEFVKAPETVFERNYSVLTEDEFRYYMRFKYMSDGNYRNHRPKITEPDFAFVAQRQSKRSVIARLWVQILPSAYNGLVE